MRFAATLLIADDNLANLKLMKKMLEKSGYSTITAENGAIAWDKLQTELVDLVLTDVYMPTMTGMELLEKMKSSEQFKDIPVVMVSGDDDVHTAADGILAGADDFIKKPVVKLLLEARIESCLESKELREKEKYYKQIIYENNLKLEERINDQVNHLTSANLATIFSMAKLAETRDPETGTHLERVKEISLVLAKEYLKRKGAVAEIDETWIENFAAATVLHDIGKIGIPDIVLLKQASLSPEEEELMKTHCSIGAKTLKAILENHEGNEFIKLGSEIAETHHEKWDGSGYPKGLSGTDIPLSGRIVSIADSYDVMTSNTVYRESFNHEKAVQLIAEDKNKAFDPELTELFLDLQEEIKAIKVNLPDMKG